IMLLPLPPLPTLFPYTTLFRSNSCFHGPKIVAGCKYNGINPVHNSFVVGYCPVRFDFCDLERCQEFLCENLRIFMLFIGEIGNRSEEHTSELQSRENLVCRLLL